MFAESSLNEAMHFTLSEKLEGGGIKGIWQNRLASDRRA